MSLSRTTNLILLDSLLQEVIFGLPGRCEFQLCLGQREVRLQLDLSQGEVWLQPDLSLTPAVLRLTQAKICLGYVYSGLMRVCLI